MDVVCRYCEKINFLERKLLLATSSELPQIAFTVFPSDGSDPMMSPEVSLKLSWRPKEVDFARTRAL
jgi:hypothetical protein